ncbi:MAG: T9SS type A sorting domain-containing protein [Bacteroidales bacterium]
MKQTFTLLISLMMVVTTAIGQTVKSSPTGSAAVQKSKSPSIVIDPLQIEAIHATSLLVTEHPVTITNEGDEVLQWQLEIGPAEGYQHVDVKSDSLPCTDSLYSTGCSVGDGLVYWQFADITVPDIPCSGNPDWYHDYTDLNHSLPSGTQILTVQAGYNDTYFDVWIDFNDDLQFSDDEIVLNDAFCDSDFNFYDFEVLIPDQFFSSGEHLMRVRTNYDQPVEDACETYSYGNCCDFRATVITSVPTFWLTADTTAGSVAPGASQEVVISLSSADLSWGYYHAILNFESNDPVNPLVTVNASLSSATTCPWMPPENLYFYHTGSYVHLFWEEPPPPTDVIIRWDDGINDDGIGLTSGGTFWVAAHWEPEQIAAYDDRFITEISIFPRSEVDASFVLKIWTGEYGDQEILSQNVDVTNNEWNNIVYSNPVQIDADTDLWIGYEVTHEAGDFPAGVDAGPAVAGYGDMISTGGGWVAMSDEYGLDYNWNIAARVSLTGTPDGKSRSIKRETVNNNETSDGWLAKGNLPPAEHPEYRDTSDFLNGYNVYLLEYGGDLLKLNENLVQGTSYTWHSNNYYGRTIYICAEYDSCESCAFIDLINDIEEYGKSGMIIYPNPAKEMMTIKSIDHIRSVKLRNATGQMVYQSRTSGNEFHLNTSTFEPGIYVLEVKTENGINMQKLVIQ